MYFILITVKHGFRDYKLNEFTLIEEFVSFPYLILEMHYKLIRYNGLHKKQIRIASPCSYSYKYVIWS